MNATLYDPADVAFACCEKGRPGRACDDCAEASAAYQADMSPRAAAEQQPVTQQPNQRVQIGPLDV